MTSRLRTSTEQGFTLIEMLIAMILLSSLIVGVSMALTKSFGESDRAQNERVVAQQARTTFAQFGSDITGAQSPDRNPAYVGNTSELGDALLQPETSHINLKLPGETAIRQLDVRDVVEATGTSFAFRSDALPATPGVECVRYAVDPTQQFVRTVMSYDKVTRKCTTVLSTMVLMKQVR